MVWTTVAPLAAGRLVVSEDAAPWARVRSFCIVDSVVAEINFGSALAICVRAPDRPFAATPASVTIWAGVRAFAPQRVSAAARGAPRMARRDKCIGRLPFRLLARLWEPPEGRPKLGRASVPAAVPRPVRHAEAPIDTRSEAAGSAPRRRTRGSAPMRRAVC